MKTFTTKSVEKLLLSLNNDPRLQSLDDTTILSEEQYPIAFDALIMRIKDPITLTTTVDTINYDDASAQAQSIPAAMRTQLKEKQNKLRNILQLNPTVDNPWDEVTAAHWMHRVTNICLDAAQMALMTVDTSPGMGYLFAPSTTADNTVRRGDKRNVEGQLLYHTLLLNSPWELPVNYRDLILDLMGEKDPYLILRSQPDPTYPVDYWGEEYFSTDRQKALQTIQTTKSSIVVLLNRIHKFTSHTFHVLLRELIPGAKQDKSNLFTMIKEHRNQYMIRARETNNLVPYTAKNTLDFIRAKFVKTNANTTHIAWTKILLHTREIGQAIYQWQASFDPLIRAFEQARTKKMRRMHVITVKQLIAKQITDNEKIILSGINPNYSVDNVDKGTFILKEFQDHLALNTARFKGYTPDARIVAHLRTRAKEFATEVPAFLNRKQQDPRPQAAKRKFKKFQHYMTSEETNESDSQEEEQTQLYMKKGHPKGLGKGLGKGKGKGKKGKPGKGGYRDHQHRHVAPQLSFDGPKGKGKGKGKFPLKGKGKSFHFGDRGKGDAGLPRRSESSSSPAVSSHTAITCGFCHKIGHTIDSCRKRQALHSSTLYQQTRSKFSGRQQLLFDKLEDSVFSPNTCTWCLCSTCDGNNCSPPEEPLFYTQTNNAFCEEILPLVKNAKLEFPIDSGDPASPQHYHFQDSHWGEEQEYPYAHQYASEHNTYIYDVNNDNEYNQYHYPEKSYFDESWESEWDNYPLYNYGSQTHEDTYEPPKGAEDNSSKGEGLLLEEDEDETIHSDGYDQ